LEILDVKLLVIDNGQPRVASRDGAVVDYDLILPIVPNNVPPTSHETSSNLATFWVSHDSFEVTTGGIQHSGFEFSKL